MVAKDDEKDRFGNKLRDAERGREDQYHKEQDRRLLEELRRTTAGDADAKIREAARQHCPECGARLEHGRMHGVSVESCPSCHGVWLTKQNLDEIARHEDNGWIARWLRREFP